MTHPLQTEIAFYEKKKEELQRSHPGKFVVIVGEEILGVYDTEETAYANAVRTKGNVPMLIRRVGDDGEKLYAPALHLGLIYASI